MDPIPASGAAPTAAGVNKVPESIATTLSADTKPAEPVAAETKPVEEKKEEPAPVPETSAAPAAEPAKLEEPPALAPPADAPVAADKSVDAPKPASIEEVPDKDGPVATTGVGEPKAIPSEQPATTSAPTAEPVKESVEEPIAQEPAKAGVTEDEPIKEPITEKPEAVNGAATNDVQMTGALNDAEPAAAGEREAAPQAIPSEVKVGDKRKADDLVETNGANGTNGTEEAVEEKQAEKKAKRGPGRPPSNGAVKQSPKKDTVKESPKKDSPNKEKESFGHKMAKNVKKIIPPVGRTARKTRSQGPA